MKKFISLFIIISMLFSLNTFAFSQFEEIEKDINIIIETYSNNIDEIENIYDKIKSFCTNNISEIKYIYTEVFYGFSVTVSSSYLNDIKKSEGVKNVYIAKEYTIPEIIPSDDTFYNKTKNNINLFSTDNSYNGKGTIVAVIDSEFRLNHNCFTSLPSELKYSKSDMMNIFSSNSLHCEDYSDITYESTWYSDKIPFFYDYGEKDTITTGTNYHGTSVASLIAGNNSNLSNFATQAQLALFKISDKNGDITTEYILAALDDAYKIKVDAVNISFGDNVGFVNNWNGLADELNFSHISKKFKDAGIPIFVATGNSSNSGNIKYNNKYYSLAENPDTGTLSSYASQINIISSGALEYSSSNPPKIASYSSIGATNDLRLAPDLTFFGNTKYAYGSSSSNYKTGKGTSFSTPLLCGIYLACKEYFKENYKSLSENEIANYIEQALMSTANLVKYNNVSVSPRQQGAGYPDIALATLTPVVLIGSDNKTKINLFEIDKNTFTFKFNAKNYSTESHTYALSAEFITDNYKKINNSSINYMTPCLLENTVYAFDCGNEVTLLPGETKEITVSASLPEEIINEYEKIFKSGLFIEGYIYLNDKDNIYPQLHIPFMGFKGKWNTPKIFDTSNVYNYFGFYYNNQDDINLYNSGIIYVNPKTASWRMGVLRNVADFKVDVVKGNILKNRLTASNGFRKNYLYNNEFHYSAFYGHVLLKDSLDEGQYKIIYSGKIEYDNAETQSCYQNIIIDRTNPELTVKRIAKNNRVYLQLNLKDNYMIDFFSIEQYKGEEKTNDFNYTESINSPEYTGEYDITDAQLYNYKVTVYDCALNQNSYMLNESSYTSYISGYNSDKKLIKIKLYGGILTFEDATDIASTFDDTVTEIKYYVWDGLNPMIIPVKLR